MPRYASYPNKKHLKWKQLCLVQALICRIFYGDGQWNDWSSLTPRVRITPIGRLGYLSLFSNNLGTWLCFHAACLWNRRSASCPSYILTCAPTFYQFLVESFDCFGLMQPSFASVDFGRIHAVWDFPVMSGVWLHCNPPSWLETLPENGGSLEAQVRVRLLIISLHL